MNRLEAAKQAIKQMKSNLKNIIQFLHQTVFFLSLILLNYVKNNIKGIIQPGGSKNDKEVIDVANKNKISLVLTGLGTLNIKSKI